MRRTRFAALLLACMVTPAVAQSNGDSSATDGSSGTPVDPVAQATAQANAATAMYNAQKAASDAQKAAIDAKSETAKAGFGSFVGTTSTLGGSTSPPSNGTSAEATLLVTLAANKAADDIAHNIQANINGKRVLVLTDLTQLSTADAMQFDLKINLVSTSLSAAQQVANASIASAELPANRATLNSGSGTRGSFLEGLTPVGAGFDAASKLASYFQTDYNFNAITVTEPTNLTAGTMAAALLRLPRGANNGPSGVLIPSNLLARDAQPVLAVLAPVQVAYLDVVGLDARLKSLSASYKAKAPSVSAALDQADAQATKAIASYDALMNGLTQTPSGTNEAAIVRIVREKQIQHDLGVSNSLVLLVIDQKIAESYTKKNLWTFFGGPPLYTMGGISSVYLLYDPASGEINAAGAIPKHGGYKSVSAVQKLIP